MRFYTNVQLIGNQFLVRGVENGKRYAHRDEFFPTLFVRSKKKTKYKTLNRKTIEGINSCLNIKNNKKINISNFPIINSIIKIINGSPSKKEIKILLNRKFKNE